MATYSAPTADGSDSASIGDGTKIWHLAQAREAGWIIWKVWGVFVLSDQEHDDRRRWHDFNFRC